MKNYFKNKYILLSLAVAFFAVGEILFHSFSQKNDIAVHSFEKVLHKKEQRLKAEMALLAKRTEEQNYFQLFAQKPNYYNDLLQNDGLALLIYENDTLKFWSDNSIAVENWVKEVCLDAHMAKLHNGWFEVMRPETNSTTTKTIVGLILIKNEYPYQNKYLTNEYQKDFAVPADTKLLTNTPNEKNSIKNTDGNYLFSLALNLANDSASFTSYVSVVFNLLGFLFVFLFLFQAVFLFENKIKINYLLFIFSLFLILFRYLSIRFLFPENFYNFELFRPNIFADASSVWLTSLGDLLINAILLFILSYLFFTKFEFKIFIKIIGKTNSFVIALVIFLGYFWFSWLITKLFIGLIKNSNIPFTLNNLFALNQYSYIGIAIIGLLLFVYFLFADKLVFVLKQLSLSKKQQFFVFIFSAIVHTFISHLLGVVDLIIVLWPFLLIIFILLFKKSEKNYSFSGIIFLVFLFSLYAVHVFINQTESKEKESRKIFAEKLAAEQDAVAELLFQDVEKKLNKDSILISFVNKIDKQPAEFEKRIKQQYFSGFWAKYDVRVALFDSMCVPIIKSQNAIFDNNLYFDELISKGGKPTSCEHFYFLNNTSGKVSYLAKLPLFKKINSTQKFGTLYVELDAKFISDEIGFPELLLDRNIGLSQELTNYSYAKYKNNQLINQYGKFSYSLLYSYLGAENNNFIFKNFDGFNHLIYKAENNTIIILSKRNEGTIGEVTSFSYLFSFFSLLLLTILFFRQISKGQLFENISFKYRIQVLLVFIVLVSLALFGGGTIYYIKQQFEAKNKDNISEKIHSVLVNTEGELSSENDLKTSLTEYVSFLLKKYATIFFTDINLYDTHGNLYASSSSKVFDEGLTSKKMNPEAYLQMAVLGKTEFVHDEQIGKLEYLSAYIPFKNKDGKLLAYLNLPYFAKQSELEKEISTFLVALINIYVLLFALSIITAILISNYVTKPLKLIQDKLSNIKLGKTNEPIDWQEKDEIGSLVSEYNRMISELAKSAELLAKSERESAWREMAKQVAHEIKNPLTPMKLSVQHLQRTYNDGAVDMDEKMERLTKNIIEQIDTLSSIATEFSNFAKMPKANLGNINLEQTIINTVDLHKNDSQVEIVFENKTIQNPTVLADKEQLIRVFNNLIKNAIQAIPENNKGRIKILLEKEKNQFIVSINDNGTGINDDVVDKIFTPNFTTKTGGMGLGLAMVKNIVETIDGKIWFETKANSGTTFFVALPCVSES